MDINIKRKMEDIFKELGFEEAIINDKTVYTYHDRYYRLDYMGSTFQCFVIESAANYDEATKNLFEDDETYPVKLGEESVLSLFREDLKKYHMW